MRTANKSGFRLSALLFLASLFVPVLCLGQGGPPMITDDPDTPGNKHWEINAADIATLSRTRSLNFVPYLDIGTNPPGDDDLPAA